MVSLKQYINISKALVVILVLGYTINLQGQEEVSSNEIELYDFESTEIIPVVDNSNHIHIFYKAFHFFTHLEFDEDYKLLKEEEFIVEEVGRKHVNGYRIGDDGEIQLYLSVKNRRKFTCLTIKDSVTTVIDFEFKLKGERFVSAINFDNQFHLLSVTYGKSILHRYTFQKDSFTKTDYPLNSEIFSSWNNHTVPLATILSGKKVEIITSGIPNAIEITSKPVKVYPSKNHIILSLNHRKMDMKLIELSLTESTAQVSSFSSPHTKSSGIPPNKTNSYLFGDNLFQMAVNNQEMVLNITDIGSNKEVRSFSVSEEDEISFKNSSIIQNGGMLSSRKRKELDNTKSLLRKLSNSEIGLSVFQKNNELNISIGGIKEKTAGKGGAFASAFAFGIVGAVIYASVAPLSYNYYSYANTRSVGFKSVLDVRSFEHLKSEPESNPFDALKKYYLDQNLNSKARFQTIFEHNGQLIFSYFHRKDKIHKLVQLK